jgi:hypothetical protein
MSLDTLQLIAQDTTTLVVRTVLDKAPSDTLWGMDKSTLLAGAFGVLGVLIGAYVTWLVELRAKRKDITYAMHREFFGVEMGDTRADARERLPFIIELTFKELDADQPNAKANLPIWKMVRFYQRLAVMMKGREVHPKLIPALFGGTFLWWHEVFFRSAVADTKWTMADHMTELRASMRSEIARQKRRVIWKHFGGKKGKLKAAELEDRWNNVWVKQGVEDRAKVLLERAAIRSAPALPAGFVPVLEPYKDL